MKLLAAVALLVASPASAQTTQQRVEAVLAQAPAGTRFGLVVADDRGAEIVAVRADERFMPASNTKILTTAAAFADLTVDALDALGGAAVRIVGDDVVLQGRGDARLSSAADCVTDCLAMLADAVAARTRRVRDVVGDDSLSPDQRWSPGMSWNNLLSRSGTGTSALSLDDNELAVRITAGAVGAPPVVIQAYPYYVIDNRATAVAGARSDLGFDRDPGSRKLRITGTVGAAAAPSSFRVSIDDPAHYAAWRLKTLLEARGVRVTGSARAEHRLLTPQDDPALRKGAPPGSAPTAPALTTLTPAPLAEDIHLTNKQSQNLDAELLMRRLGRVVGGGSIADGVARVEAVMGQAGVPRAAWDIFDGSGMSSYNRVSPRAMVTLLRWIAAQPWGLRWRDTLPVGGVDGTLAARFKGTVLAGRIFAKTGSLNATNALSGYLIAKSGRTLTFSALANDVPAGTSAIRQLDAALIAVAENN